MLPTKHKPIVVSKYALTCYCGYSIATSSEGTKRTKLFLNTLWKYFLAHECMFEEILSNLSNKTNLYVSGHPKLDVFENYCEKENDKNYVIYAPHHSIGNSILKWATFDWSGKFMLDYAKNHPEINWVFKPHPNLKNQLIEQGYSQKEIENYYDEWNKIAKSYFDGDYFEIFKNSKAMITDCGSFLVEYFLTGKPLLHLISETAEKHSSLNRLVNKYHYSVFNQETLKEYLDEIVIKNNDFLKEIRKKNIKNIFQNNFNSAQNIYDFLQGALKNG